VPTGVRAEVLAVCLLHLARDRADDAAVGELVDEDVLGRLDPHLEGVLVQELDALDRRVVVELVVLARFRGRLLGTNDVRLDLGELSGAQLRVQHALQGVDVIRRDQLALLSLESGIVGEVDAGLDAQGVSEAVGADLGKGDGGGRVSASRAARGNRR
jgi:hypothetical protein